MVVYTLNEDGINNIMDWVIFMFNIQQATYLLSYLSRTFLSESVIYMGLYWLHSLQISDKSIPSILFAIMC